MQREPILLTKNNRPVGVMISIEDIKDPYIADLFAEKVSGYDEWVKYKVETTIKRFEMEGSKGVGMKEVHASIMDKIHERLASKK